MVHTFFSFPPELRDQIYDRLLEDMVANGLPKAKLGDGKPDVVRVRASKNLYVDQTTKPLFYGLVGSCSKARKEVNECE